MARDFAGALATSETGLKLDPSYRPLETNHAHALMFLGRTPEAETLYLQYRGKKVFGDSGDNWEQVILDDFKSLEGEGITSPEMAHVRDLLKPTPK